MGAQGTPHPLRAHSFTMTPRLYRVFVPSRVLVLAFDEEAAAQFVLEEQVDNLIMEEMSVVKLTEENILPKEREVRPYFSGEVKERIIRAASNWLLIIKAEEDEERRQQEDFARRQLKLPGVE